MRSMAMRALPARRFMATVLLVALVTTLVSDRIGWTDGAFPRVPEGGRKWLCPVLGLATAGALLTPGAQWSAIGFMLWAGTEGCL